MFRLILSLCLFHITVSTVIRGRVLLNGDEEQISAVPARSLLTIRLEDASLADASAILLKEVKISNPVSFPIDYEIRVPNDASKTTTYSLSARIQKAKVIVYINEEHIPVSIDTDGPILVDIPVSLVREVEPSQPLFDELETSSWPELVGRKGVDAVKYIKQKTGLTNVETVPEGSMVTMDYRVDRVRVFVDENGIVTQTPRTG